MTPVYLKHEASLAAVFIVLWFAATSWARPLLLPDEGRYVGVAWEMLRSGEWLTPTLNGLPYFHKPPLFYWITAASLWLFGLHEAAARAAPILGASIGTYSLYLFARRWSGQQAARFSLLALLAQPLFFIGGQFANLDMLVAGCITATVLLLAHAALCQERQLAHQRAVWAAYAMAALGVLAKGLIGFVIPAMVVGIWLLLSGRRKTLPALMSVPGVLLFAALAAPWFITMQLRFTDFFDYFFVVQHFKRYATGGFNNVQPIWFYPAVLLLFTLPWLPWLRHVFARGYFSHPQYGPLRGLMWLWIASVVVFFSLPKSKLLGYVLPAVPAVAYLMADALLSLGEGRWRARWRWFASAFVSIVLSLAAVTYLSIHPQRSTRELALALKAQRGPHEPVLMLNQYYFDLPYYARLREPVTVIDDWSNADIAKRDNWRKELADAGQFDRLRAARLLLHQELLHTAVCAAPVSWILGADTAGPGSPVLAYAQKIATQRGVTLWRVDMTQRELVSAAFCPGKPNADSTRK